MTKQAIQHAVAMVLVTAGIASAQYRVDRSGANDANNRIGSGGRNVVSEQPKPWQFANDVIYGNVTGGKQFRGNVASRDPFAFRGNTAGRASDDFIRDSSGVTTGGTPSYNASQSREFYGASRAAPAPGGFVQIPGTGGYVPPRPSNWRTVDQRISSMTGSAGYVFRPDLYGGAGQIDLQYAPGAVPVPGAINARQLDTLGTSDYTQLNRNVNSQLTPQQLQQLRGELSGPPNVPPTDRIDAPMPGSALNDRLITRPTNDALSNSTQSLQLNNQLDQSSSAELGVRSRLVTAAEQSSAYAQLQGRRTEQEKVRLGQGNAEAARQFNADLAKQKQADEKKKSEDQPTPGVTPGAGNGTGNGTGPDTGTAPISPGTGVTPGAGPRAGVGAARPGSPAANESGPRASGVDAGGGAGADAGTGAGAAVATTPLRVGTFTDDKKSGLNEMMRQAEMQMAEGKYASAMDTYESAAKVAPNNPLIKLGRTHAELGGGYYRRAEVSLREILTADKNLLAGQYDLRTFLGAERLQMIERDLGELIQKNEKDAGPAILQAYVYYNTSNERRAAALLELAQKRTDGKDPFVTLLKQNWTLPAADGAEQNK
ncbi:MAG: hypothetical protein H7144_00105 [Burkholderiales bacterium]|nr:hypothetical protein [Phycisphaerae bacterium]